MYYLIGTTLEPCAKEDVLKTDRQAAAILSTAEWNDLTARLNIETDMEMDMTDPRETKAVVNTDSLTGTLCRPSLTLKKDFRGRFAFAINEKGIVLVDDSGYAERIVGKISRTKKWKLPGLERFLYDLLETVIADDLSTLEEMDKRLNRIEDGIMKGEITGYPLEMNDIRGDLLDLRVHYEQMIDLGQELMENENDFFKDENLRYFHMFTERVIRLQEMVNAERDYVAQLRDLQQAQLEVRQNTIMTVLTVITTIFLPLTLIAGWYGMNFIHMPELSWIYGYPAIIIISVLIVAGCLYWFKKKKWM